MSSTQRETVERVFLVGCPRSGTTLLQGMLAAHPGVISFPESHFFSRALGPRRSPRRPLGLIAPGGRTNLIDFLRRAGLQRFEPQVPGSHWVAPYCRMFLHTLDTAARDAAKPAWLEKTPEHVFHTAAIRRYSPQAKFVHILRHGTDTIASLVDVTRKHPEHWGGSWSVEHCVRYWNRAVRASLRWRNNPQHFLVFYESLVAEPEQHARRLADFLGLPFAMEMIDKRSDRQAQVVDAFEVWKQASHGELRKAASRAGDVFDPATIARVESQTAEVERRRSEAAGLWGRA